MQTETDIVKRIEQLENLLSINNDKCNIENLMAHHHYLLSAGAGNSIIKDMWAQNIDDVSIEIGASGVYVGLKKVSTFYEKDCIAGKMNFYALTTPLINVNADGKTANGTWIVIATETDAGDLGNNKPKTIQSGELLSSKTPKGERYQADWVWHRLCVDFLKQDGVWKLLHVHVIDMLRFPQQSDWVLFSEIQKQMDGIRIDEMFTSNIPYKDDEPHENNASKATTYHWQYDKNSLPPKYPQK